MIRILSIFCALFAFLVSSFNIFAGPDSKLTLEESLKVAYSTHPVLMARQMDVDAAKGEVTTSRSGFLPKLTGDASLQQQLREPAVITPTGAVVPLNDKTLPQTSLTLDQTIYDFGRTLNTYRGAKIGKDIQESNVDLFKQDLGVDVVKVYFGVILAQKNVSVAKTSNKSLNEYYRTVNNMYEQEAVTKNDLLAADVFRSQSSLKVDEALKDLEIAQLNFLRVVGVEPENLDHKIFKRKPLSKSLKVLTEEASLNRIELAINEQKQEQVEAARKKATSQYLPDVYGQAVASYQHDSVLLNKDQYTFIVGLRWPFFDGLAAAGERNTAKARQKALKYQKKALMDRITVEVARAKNNVEIADRTIKVEEKSKRQSTENLRIQKQLYENGACTVYDVLNAQSMWTDTQYAYYAALYDYNIYKALLLRAVGRPIEGEW